MANLDFTGMLDDISLSVQSQPDKSSVSLNTDLQDRIKQADEAYRTRFGKPLPVTSTVRTKEQQAALYANRATNAYPVAAPGTSKHETGNAVDIDSNVPESFLNEFGLHRPIKNDPVHVELLPQQSEPDLSNSFNDIFANVKGDQPPPETEQPVPLKTIKDITNTYLVAPVKATYKGGKAIVEAGANLASGTFGSLVAGPARFYSELAQGKSVREAAKAEEETAAAMTYQPRTKEGQLVAEYNPLTLAGKALAYGGGKVGDVAQYTATKMGAPLPVAATIGGVTDIGTQAAAQYFGAKAIPAVTKGKTVGRGEIISGAPAETDIPAYVRKQQAARAQLQQQLEQKQQAAGKPEQTQPVQYTSLTYAENEHAPDVQKQRAGVVQRVMGNDFNVDPDAVAGRGRARATSYQTSLTDTAVGNLYKNVFENEQAGLRNYSNKLIDETGGTIGLDQKSVIARGRDILKPFNQLENWFKTRIKQIYKDRDEVASGIPVTANNILNVLMDESKTAINTESIGLQKGVIARMRQLKMIDENGNLLPTNARTAESLRQYINENWDRKNANLHRSLKEAVDEDVIADLPESSPIYKDARALVELQKNTLENPKGISNIIEASGPNQINRKVDIEKIPDKVIGLGVEQVSHIIDTLKNVPPEIQPTAQKALAQIKAHFLNELDSIRSKAGNVDAVKVTEFLNDNNEVMSRLFTPEEMARIKDYNDAAHIFKTDTGYKGSAVQTINVGKRLGFGQKTAEKTAQGLAAATAEKATGGLTQGVAGGAAYEATGGIFERRRLKKQAEIDRQLLEKEQKRFTPISELLKGK